MQNLIIFKLANSKTTTQNYGIPIIQTASGQLLHSPLPADFWWEPPLVLGSGSQCYRGSLHALSPLKGLAWLPQVQGYGSGIAEGVLGWGGEEEVGGRAWGLRKEAGSVGEIKGVRGVKGRPWRLGYISWNSQKLESFNSLFLF